VAAHPRMPNAITNFGLLHIKSVWSISRPLECRWHPNGKRHALTSPHSQYRREHKYGA
jgi:hypothetical protein